ncbi:hypothetical protein OAZ97_02575, partial [Prochlorococcus sp. AH-736-E15]|nr:hypothetical protein [Prochlorococcus sp. AH-736-E15]
VYLENAQRLLTETYRVLKKNQYLYVNIIFNNNDEYFNNLYKNICQINNITYGEFIFKFQYCQVKRLLEPFFKIINYSLNEPKNDSNYKMSFWKVLAKKI